MLRDLAAMESDTPPRTGAKLHAQQQLYRLVAKAVSGIAAAWGTKIREFLYETKSTPLLGHKPESVGTSWWVPKNRSFSNQHAYIARAASSDRNRP